MRRRKGALRQIILVPNFITAFGLACGLFVIFKAIMTNGESRLYELFNASVILLLLAVFADFLDGTLARVMKAETEFGFMFDSLSDAITFGVAPAVLYLKTVRYFSQEGEFVFISIVCAMIYAMCGVLRLVRFNVKSVLVKGNKQEELALKKSFIGLPIPAAAVAIVSSIFFLISPQFQSWVELTPKARTIIIGLWMVFIGYLMICRWQFPSLKTLHFRVPSFQMVFFSMIGIIFLLYGLLYYLPLVFFGASVFYLVLGAFLSVTKFIKAKKISRRFRRRK